MNIYAKLTRGLTVSILVASFSFAGTGYANPQNLDLAKALFQALNAHDLDAVVNKYAENAVLVSPDACAPMKGKEAVRQNYAGLLGMLPDLKVNVVNMVAAGDMVAVEFTSGGTMQDMQIEFPLATFLAFKDGKIVSDHTYFDTGMESKCHG